MGRGGTAGIPPWRRASSAARRTVIDRRVVSAGGVRVAYEVAGEGPPVVLIHGLGGSGSWWARNVPELSRHFRIYMIDVIGFGSSGGQPFVLADASRQLVAWMDALGMKRATFVGHSMGGFIAADLAAEHPDRVERLVLVNSAALPFEWGYTRHLVNSIRGLRYFSPRFFPIAIRDSFRAGPLTLLGGIRQILAADLTEKLARIEAPTLVLWGAGDPLIPPEIGERLSREVRHGTFALVDAAAHNPMWERPEDFNRLVLEFLSEGQAPAD
jgi:pimeloyl-ACP methyl ester carboxylesterase